MMHRKNKQRNRGFIALMSAVIISAIMLGFLFTTDKTTFYARFDALDSEYKHIASDMAEACVNQALLKLAQDYHYDSTATPVSVGDGTCSITSMTPLGPARTGNSATITINTQGSYKNTFSTFQTQVTAYSPSVTAYVPAPSCYLTISPTSIVSGQTATLLWSANNATGSQLSIVATGNSANTVSPINISTATASGSIGRTPAASETWVGTITNSLGTYQCTAPPGSPNPSVIVQPPATCADTVMMFDRTGSMSSTDLSNERNAGTTLLNLYKNAIPPGQVSIGSFGAYPNASLPAGAASIASGGTLSQNWSTLTTTLNSITGSNSSVGSNLSDAISDAAAELNSIRHDITKSKVFIFVTDGEPNEPTGSTAYDTTFKSPTANVQNASGELWSNPTNAYTDGGGDASDPVSENDRHRFYNFNFPTIPTGSTITGIEAKADTWATTTSVVAGPTTNILKSPTGTMSSPNNQWNSASNAFVSDNVYATDSTNGHTQGYSNFGFNIPSNATITGIAVTTEAKISGSGGAPTNTLALYPKNDGNYNDWNNGVTEVDETGTSVCNNGDYIDTSSTNDRSSFTLDLSSIPNGSTINNVTITAGDRGDSSAGGTYRTFIRMNGTNTDASGSALAATGSSGSACTMHTQTITPASVVKGVGTTLEIGVVKVSGNSNTVRVGVINATVNYTPTGSGSVTIALSSNNGTSWTSSENTSITSSETVASPTGNSSSDMWGRAWIPSDFNNGNFALRVGNTSVTGSTVSLDQVTANVYYTVPTSAPVACQLGVDLSYDNGVHFTPTTEKTATLTGTETTYTLGSSSDTWGRTWGLGDFINSKFIARVHAIDPGSGCDNSSVDHLDWLQVKVHYSQLTDPSVATVTSANAAKAGGVEIFTVRYSSDTDATAIALLKQIASGPSDYFSSPTTQAGITAIFNTIATQVCPAAIAPPTPPTPPSPPPPPPPPPNITVGSWQEI